MNPKQLLFIMALIISLPTFGQSNQTKKVAVLEIVDKDGNVAYGVKLMIRSKLGTAINNTAGFEAYDRVDIASIMNEQEFQRTGLVDATQIKKLGEMTGANYILVAEVAELDEKNIVILAKILDVESAKIERTANLHSEISLNSLQNSCMALAERLLKIKTHTGLQKGELRIGDNIYFGEYKDEKPHGSGKMIYTNGILKCYTGRWNDGVYDGYGTLEYNDGLRYEGNFKAGQRHGKGIYYYSNNYYYKGSWENGFINGIGELIRNGRVIFKGEWSHYEKHGLGTEYYETGDYEEAIYDKGKKNGLATYYFKNGTYEKGVYIDNKREGKWKLYDENNHLLIIKIYKNDRLINTTE